MQAVQSSGNLQFFIIFARVIQLLIEILNLDKEVKNIVV
jgi:hypothetical protein